MLCSEDKALCPAMDLHKELFLVLERQQNYCRTWPGGNLQRSTHVWKFPLLSSSLWNYLREQSYAGG